MTERSESERAELVDELEHLIPRYPSDQSIIDAAASALRRLAAQDQKPPPAAGWNETALELADRINTAYRRGVSCVISHTELRKYVTAIRHNAPPDTGAGKSQTDDLCRDISKMAERVGAEFVPDQQKIDAFDAAHMPDHGGADAGVEEGWTGRKCPHCKGTGENLKDDPVRPCSKCGGTGDEYGPLSKPAPVQDTHLVCGSDLKAMSGSVESDRVIQLHFKRKVIDRDRAWLLEAINAKIAADRQPAPVAANARAELSKFANDLAANQEPLGVQISAEDLERAYIRDEPTANASAELQNDLGEMLRALGMPDAAQPRSPHEVFQSAIAEMKRQIADASAEARLREALRDLVALVSTDSRYDDSESLRSARNILFAENKAAMLALSAHPHASDCDKQKECCDLAAKKPCADCPFPNPDAATRGLTDLERTLLIASKAAQNYIANTESELGMTLKSGELLRAAIAKAEACEISTHPHASDCDKQGETRCNARRCYDLGCFGLCGDETTKSEGGVKAGAPVVSSEVSNTAGATRQFVGERHPSDRTADVTGYLPIHECYETGDDEVTVVELKTFLDKQWPAPHGDVARALLGAFTVGRR